MDEAWPRGVVARRALVHTRDFLVSIDAIVFVLSTVAATNGVRGRLVPVVEVEQAPHIVMPFDRVKHRGYGRGKSERRTPALARNVARSEHGATWARS